MNIERARTKIKGVLQQALEENIITNNQFDSMNPENKEVGNFYCNFKIHKPNGHKKAPPERPIVSQLGTMCENIATYVDYHISHIGTKHQSYLPDTPDFLRNIQRINEGPELDDKCILFTLDVIGLYTNIIHEEGLTSLENELEKRSDKTVPTQFIMK